MVIPVILLKIAAQWWPFSRNSAARKGRSHRNPPPPSTKPSSPHAASAKRNTLDESKEHSAHNTTILVSDFCYTLLNPTATTPFPYFMLVAFEAGSLPRALLLLLSYPLLSAIGCRSDLDLRVMAFITFCGLRVKDVELVARAVLPKFYLENLRPRAYDAVASRQGRKVVVLSRSLPRAMVAGFCEEYLGVGEVVGSELKVVKGRYFSGLVVLSASTQFGEYSRADVGLVSSYNKDDQHLFLSHCKEVRIMDKEEEDSVTLRREMYPKPLIFHDSRLAFLPTPLRTFSLFLFLPFLLLLSLARIFLGIVPPYKLIFPIAALIGTRFRVDYHATRPPRKEKGVIYVCTHRTLLDPVMLSVALQRPVPAVTYSVSPLSEAIAPMCTVRLTRNRSTDAKRMRELLEGGELTICPEGTTCREPYLLRFSPLFAEMTDRIVPAAMEAEGSWFYGTTASGLKSLDPLVFFMNPWPTYRVRILEQVPREMTRAGGWSGLEVANRIQKQLGDVLGFQCTELTRKDKYIMLAGNEGVAKKPAM